MEQQDNQQTDREKMLQKKAQEFLEFQRKGAQEAFLLLQALSQFFRLPIQEVQRRIALIADGEVQQANT